MGEAESVHAERMRVESDALRHLVGVLGLAGFGVALAVGERSARVQTPADALREGDTFHLTVRDAVTGERAGWVLLIPGNGPDLVSDWGWREGAPAEEGMRMRLALEAGGL